MSYYNISIIVLSYIYRQNITTSYIQLLSDWKVLYLLYNLYLIDHYIDIILLLQEKETCNVWLITAWPSKS